MAWFEDHADQGLVASDAGNRHAPGRNTVDEVGCPIDRIDHPCETGRTRFVVMFLSDNSILRKQFFKPVTYEDLHLGIGIGNEILLAFCLYHEVADGSEIGESQFTGIAGNRSRRLDALLCFSRQWKCST